jgi:predicted PurR-regulated permease PerM
MSSTKKETNTNIPFDKKIWITVKIVVLTIAILLIFQSTFRIFLLVLAGSLIAIFFRSISDKIQRLTKLKESISVGIAIVASLLIVAGLFWLIGAKVQTQINELSETLPKTIDHLKNQINSSSLGENVMNKLTSSNSINKAQSFVGKFFESTFGIFGDLYVVLFIGIFFTISPKIYANGFIQLLPIKKQEKGKQILKRLNEQLRKWLKGKLFSMVVVFILTAIGLAILGMPLWLVLALLAGLISFIPNFGPLISLIPAVLIALLESLTMAALVIGLYALIQFIESNFITPFVQKKLINMPPALIIISQLIMGVLTGGWGLILATPITVILIVLVQELYLKERES